MSTNYRKLGDIVELIDERNKDGKVQTLIGVSIDKCFIKSVANTIGTDLTKYQVIRKNDFACSLMQVSRDGKIPIACLKDYDEAIMSPAYYIFRIRNTNEVLPDYLAMWFMRTEFDREASYIAVGGVRGSMPWEDFCDMKLPVPDLREQEKIVNTYNAITKRIQLKQKINENLEKTAQCLFEKIYQNNESWTDGVISDLGEIVSGATPSTEIKEYFCQNGIHWLSPKDLTSTGFKFISKGETDITEAGYKSCSTKLMPKGTVLLTSRAPVGCIGIAENEICTNQGFKSIIPNADIQTAYIYYFLKKEVEMLKQNASGTTFDEISGSVLKSLKCKIPPKNIALTFNEQCKYIFNYQRIIEREIFKLQELKQLIISRISGM